MRWGGRFAQQRTAECLALYGRVCHLCGKPGADTADHLLPRSRGGGHDIENLRPAHARCNASRGALSVREWRARHLPRAEPRPDAEW